jgi:hypothetical protein
MVPSISIVIRRGHACRVIPFFDLTTGPSDPVNLSRADWYGVRTIATSGEARSSRRGRWPVSAPALAVGAKRRRPLRAPP